MDRTRPSSPNRMPADQGGVDPELLKERLSEAVLDTARGAPLRSSYTTDRELSDDPLQRKIQIEVRLECLRMSKQLRDEQNAMLEKNLSKKKQKQLAGVDRVARLASFMDISKEDAQKLIDAKNAMDNGSIQEQMLQVQRALKRIEQQLGTGNKEQITILKQVEDLKKSQTSGPPRPKITFTQQTQAFFQDLQENQTVFVYMRLVETASKFGFATLKQYANTVGLANSSRVNFLETFHDFIRAWSKSLLTSLKDLLYRPAHIGLNIGKIFASATNWSKITEILSDTIKDVIFFTMGFLLALIQFKALAAMVLFFDLLFGTNMHSYVLVVINEYVHFCYTSFKDGLFLIPRMLGYFFFGGSASTKTGVELWRSDERMFYAVTSLVDMVRDLMQPIWDEFQNDTWIKPVIAHMSSFFGSVYKIWEWLKESAGVVVEIVVETVKAAASAAVDLGKTITAGRPEMITTGIDSLKSSMSSIFVGSPPMLGGPAQVHTVFTACSVLGITKARFDQLQNQRMVRYVNNNSLTDFELIHVVYHAKKELQVPLRL